MTVRARTRSGRPVIIPTPQEDDFEDVHWALSAATTLWDRGEDTEALKWLRRAASAAADRDADVRAVELFKAAADVAGVVDARHEARAAQKAADDDGAESSDGATQAMAARSGRAPPAPSPRQSPQQRGPVHAGMRARSRAINRGPLPAPQAQTPRPPPLNQPGNAPQFQVRQPPPPQPKTGPPPPPGVNPRLTQAGPPTRLQGPPPPHPPVAQQDERPQRSTEPRDLVPAVPPEPLLSERFAGLGYKLDDTEEDTFIRPETMLRRALMAIDPQYADRTDIHSDGGDDDDEDEDEDDSHPGEYSIQRPYVESSSEQFDDDEEDTAKRRGSYGDDDDPENETTRERVSDLVAAADSRKSAPQSSAAPGSAPGLVPGLAAFRVAVLPIPEERDVRLIFLSPGADPPPGVAVALLVPPSPEDARLINEIYGDTDAKL